MIVAGVGFSSRVSHEDILILVREVSRTAGVAAQALAAPDFKDGAELRAAAAILDLPLLLLDRAALEAAQPRCATRSALAEAEVGLASVAEACALAGAGEQSRLLVARISQCSVTCALAEGLS